MILIIITSFLFFSQTSPPSYGLGNFVIQSWGIILFGEKTNLPLFEQQLCAAFRLSLDIKAFDNYAILIQ